jgi:hypothetical protein
MKVGAVAPGLKEFLAELGEIISDSRTAVFIDASLLIDNLKLGPKALDELHSFFESALKGRIHVPLWAAHEFHQHLVRGSAATQTSAALKDMERIGQRLYKEIAPALSEATDTPTRTAEQHRLLVRSALQDLNTSAQLLQAWTKKVRSETERRVVDFVNSHCLRSESIFGYLESIGSLSINRYEGRIPPGFRDKNKPPRPSHDGEAIEGSNTAGDLMFWREILEYVKSTNRWYVLRRYERILILTNDEKNDWQAGRGVKATPSDNTFKDADTVWNPLPIPHPMLEFEAATVCKVSRVALCTGHLLGAFLSTKKLAPTFVLSRFQIGLSKSEPKSAPPTPSAGPMSSGPPAGGPDIARKASDPPKVPVEPLPTVTEILACLRDQTSDPGTTVDVKIDRMKAISSATSDESVQDVLQNPPEPTTKRIAALLGCRLMQLADSQDAAARDALQLILKRLPDLDPSTAAWFYAGVLFGKYVRDGQIFLTPPYLLLEDIVAFESQASANPGITLIRQISQAQEGRPLYLPNGDSRALPVTLSAVPIAKAPPRLRAFLIGELDVLTHIASSDDAEIWRLRAMDVQSDMALTQHDLISLASRYYGIPSTRLTPSNGSESYTVDAQAAFKQIEELAHGE